MEKCYTGLPKIYIKKLICKVVMSVVFFVTYTNKRDTCKVLYTIWFEINFMKEEKQIKN